MVDKVDTNTDVVKAEADKATTPFKVNFEGFEFEVNPDSLDDVDALQLIDKIENKSNMYAIVEFLDYLVGKDVYRDMKEHFVKKYGRFKISKLAEVYEAIFANFDPKD